jgi:hypothetical protein
MQISCASVLQQGVSILVLQLIRTCKQTYITPFVITSHKHQGVITEHHKTFYLLLPTTLSNPLTHWLMDSFRKPGSYWTVSTLSNSNHLIG